MKISLIHNEDAGSAGSDEALRHEMEAAGHEVLEVHVPAPGVGKLIDARAELIVIAGGDGTVRRVATELVGHATPIALLPAGTANNISMSLGLDVSTEKLIAGWNGARRLQLDLGVATGPWGERRFMESVGMGFVASGITVMQRDPPEAAVVEGAEAKIVAALERFRLLLDAMVPQTCELSLDGVRENSDFLLVEALNVCAVGPRLLFSPEADPTDGLFDVVTVSEHERSELDRYLHARLTGRPARLDLTRRRARHIELNGWHSLHIDDEVHAVGTTASVSLRVEPAALTVLVPEGVEKVRSAWTPPGRHIEA